MGETGSLADIPASFTADMMAASTQFCLRQGGGWWGGGAGSMETAWMISNYTFPFRKRIFFFSKRGTLNDSSWKNVLYVICCWNTFLTDRSHTHSPSSAPCCPTGRGGGAHKAQSTMELAPEPSSASHLLCPLGHRLLSKP